MVIIKAVGFVFEVKEWKACFQIGIRGKYATDPIHLSRQSGKGLTEDAIKIRKNEITERLKMLESYKIKTLRRISSYYPENRSMWKEKLR